MAADLTQQAEDACLRLTELAREKLSRLCRRGVYAKIPFEFVITDGNLQLNYGESHSEREPKPKRLMK